MTSFEDYDDFIDRGIITVLKWAGYEEILPFFPDDDDDRGFEHPDTKNTVYLDFQPDGVIISFRDEDGNGLVFYTANYTKRNYKIFPDSYLEHGKKIDSAQKFLDELWLTVRHGKSAFLLKAKRDDLHDETAELLKKIHDIDAELAKLQTYLPVLYVNWIARAAQFEGPPKKQSPSKIGPHRTTRKGKLVRFKNLD